MTVQELNKRFDELVGVKSNESFSFEMTPVKKKLLRNLLSWYWTSGWERNLITNSDYQFIYDIHNNGLVMYSVDIQERLNRIREIYINDIKKQKQNE